MLGVEGGASRLRPPPVCVFHFSIRSIARVLAAAVPSAWGSPEELLHPLTYPLM